MSDFSQPPDPQQPPPLPGGSGPAPLASLAYSLPTTESVRPRPGALTALATTSILVACAGLLAAVAIALFGIMFFLFAKATDIAIANQPASSSLPASPPAFLAPVDQPPPAVPVGRDGLPGPHRQTATGAIQSLRPLSPARAEQLDAALARAGRRILGVNDLAQITTVGVRGAVVDHGEMFGGGRKAEPPEYFKTASGRLELYDDRAVFYPDDGSPPVRSTAAWSSAPRPLTPEQVQAVVKQVQAAPGGAGLNPAQLSGLSAVLALPNQRLAQASAGLNTEPRSVKTFPGGGATVTFGGGALHLGPRGQILNEAPTVASVRPPAANAAALSMVLVGAVAGAALAVLLLVAGIATLRDAPPRSQAGRRLHTVWVALKIPLAMGTGLALYWLLNSYVTAVGPAGRTTSARGTGVVRALIDPRTAYPVVITISALGCVYPLVALLALRTRNVRDFYRPPE